MSNQSIGGTGFTFLDYVGLGGVLTGIDQLALGERAFGAFLILGGFFFIFISRKWTAIEGRLANPIVRLIESTVGLRMLLLAALAFWFAFRHADSIARYSALAFGTFCLVWPCLNYVRSIRRDIDDYVLPRTVTARQVKRLRDFLADKSKYSVALKVNPHDEEAMRYAGQLLNALRACDWDVMLDLVEPHTPSSGLFIDATGTNNPNPQNDSRPLIQQGFGEAGIRIHGSGGHGAGAFSVKIVVGRRPLTLGGGLPPLAKFGQYLIHLGRPRRR